MMEELLQQHPSSTTATRASTVSISRCGCSRKHHMHQLSIDNDAMSTPSSSSWMFGLVVVVHGRYVTLE